MLAEAFCLADERVEAAKAALEEAQTERTRALAALSVTVGSDGAVAQLLGLAERSVRLSRRRVGRAAARQVAESMLSGPEYGEPSEADAAAAWAQQRDGAAQRTPPSVAAGAVHEPRAVADAAAAGTDPMWPATMDSLLLQGWAAGVDQQALAGQLGIDLCTLVNRVQHLTTTGERGRRYPHVPSARQPMDATTSGRHRRTADNRSAFTGVFGPPAPLHHGGEQVGQSSDLIGSPNADLYGVV